MNNAINKYISENKKSKITKNKTVTKHRRIIQL